MCQGARWSQWIRHMARRVQARARIRHRWWWTSQNVVMALSQNILADRAWPGFDSGHGLPCAVPSTLVLHHSTKKRTIISRSFSRVGFITCVRQSRDQWESKETRRSDFERFRTIYLIRGQFSVVIFIEKHSSDAIDLLDVGVNVCWMTAIEATQKLNTDAIDNHFPWDLSLRWAKEKQLSLMISFSCLGSSYFRMVILIGNTFHRIQKQRITNFTKGLPSKRCCMRREPASTHLCTLTTTKCLLRMSSSKRLLRSERSWWLVKSFWRGT